MAGLATGAGAALSYGTTTTWLAKSISIGGFDITRPSIDTSYLGTTGCRTKIGGDLYELSSFTAPFFIEPDELATGGICSFDDILFDAGEAAASEGGTPKITLTLGDAGAATFIGSGHVVGISVDDIALDQLLTGSITLQWDDWPVIAE